MIVERKEKVVVDGKETTKVIKEKVEIDAKGSILLKEPTFNKITNEVIERRAWDKYAKSTIDKVNNLNKPKPPAK